MLERYKEELSRPFDEAASFLSSVRTQLSTLCGGAASLSGMHGSSALAHQSHDASLSFLSYLSAGVQGSIIAIADMHLCIIAFLVCEAKKACAMLVRVRI